MRILSIYLGHDASLCYSIDNKIDFLIQFERYNHLKHQNFPTKKIQDLILNNPFDKLLLTTHPNNESHWFHIFENNKKFTKHLNENTIFYGSKHHHLFHAAEALTWAENNSFVWVHDEYGIKNEMESGYRFKDNQFEIVFQTQKKLGHNYSMSSKEVYGGHFQESKLMAYSDYKNIGDKNADIALKAQERLERDFFELFKSQHIKEQKIVFTGGVTQNIILNSKIENLCNKKVLFSPLCGDFGIAVGALNYYTNNKIKLNHVYLGPKESFSFIQQKTTYEEIAKLINKEPVAIVQKRSEQGQRGLGNRSLVHNACSNSSWDKLNEIKKREWYRPFALSILEEKANEYFYHKENIESPFMMSAYPLKEKYIDLIKNGVSKNKYSRLQTVSKNINEPYYNLLKTYHDLFNVPFVVNTSLNLPGDTVVETEQDLLDMLKNSKLNYVCLLDELKLYIKNGNN
jgi:predicted NodU family carbamoyl transferase